ncbi:hypothetical protein ACJZ2D_016682 [Fusarium nematophilum]
MSPATRAGFRPRKSVSTRDSIADDIEDGTENAVQKAYDLVPSTDAASIRQVWEDLRQSHHAALRNGHKLESFPYWVLRRVPHQIIPQMLEVVHGKDARRLEFSAPIVYQHFGVPQWYFVLFFDGLSEHSARKLTAITKKRRNLSFDSLYCEVKRNRSKRLKARPRPLSDDANKEQWSWERFRKPTGEGLRDQSRDQPGEHLCATNLLSSAINSLYSKHEELRQQENAIMSRMAEIMEHRSAKLQLLSGSNDSFVLEHPETEETILLGMVDLYKKRKVEETNLQEYEKKRLKLDADVTEFITNLRAGVKYNPAIISVKLGLHSE